MLFLRWVMRVFVQPTLTKNLRTWYTKPTLETDVTLPNSNRFRWLKNCRKLQRNGFRTMQTTGCCSASSLRNMRSKFHHHITSSFLLIEFCHAISRNRVRSHKVPFRIGRLILHLYTYLLQGWPSSWKANRGASPWQGKDSKKQR